MKLTEKQKFWLIQFIKFALFSVAWFWAWFVPIGEKINSTPGAGLLNFSGILAYPLVVFILHVLDQNFKRLIKSGSLRVCLLLIASLITLVCWQVWTVLIVSIISIFGIVGR